MKALGYTWRVLVNIFYLIVVLFVFNAMQRRHVETTTARPVFEPATPKVGAVCPNWARTDLCGGRSVMSVPTAILQPDRYPDVSGAYFIVPQKVFPMALTVGSSVSRVPAT